MTAINEGGHPRYLRRVESAAVGKAVTIVLQPSGDFTMLPHVFLGVQMFNSGGAQIVDSAGTFTVTVETINTKQPESPTVSVIDATAPVTISWAGNTYKITVVPASLSTTDTWKVVATANRT